MSERAAFELVAVSSDGVEAQFDGTSFAPGTHLRWSFWPELGWPTRIEIKRRYWYRDEFTIPHAETAWEVVRTIVHPPALDGVDAAMRAASTVTSGAATAVLELEAASLVRLVQVSRGAGRPILTARRGAQSIEVPAMEAVTLAALDPYAARALGLALVDGAVAPRTPVDYQAFATWGAVSYPWYETTFTEATSSELAGRLIEGERLRLSTERAASFVTTASAQRALQLVGIGDAGLNLELSQPAREVEIDLDGITGAQAASRWNVTALVAGIVVDRLNLTITGVGATLRIVTRNEAYRIDAIRIVDTAPTVTTWRIVRVRHRRRTGNIGTLASRIVRLAPVSGTTVADSVIAAFPAPVVQTPSIAETRSEPTASSLGDDGRTVLDAAQVETFLTRPGTPAAGAVELARPVRLHAGYVRAASAGRPARVEIATLSPPMPGKTLGLVAAWHLDGAAANPALVARGTVRYADTRPSPVGWNRLDMQRRTLHLTGRRDARDGGGGPGYLEASGLAALDAIGTDLHVQAWAMPIEDAEPAPTLVGNDWRTSFWFGLGKATRSYRLRAWVNGSRFDSSGAIPQNTWSHVAVHYDGERVRFFINGDVASEHAAALGPVRPNPARKLRIGCDPDASNPFAYPFAGYLADVQIRRGTEIALATQHLLAAWLLDGDLAERKSGKKSTAIGAARFAAEHPEQPTRRSAQFDGAWCATHAGSALADPGRRLGLKLRLKPDAGQDGTVIAGARGWKLWLRRESTGYRIALTIGTMTIASSILIPPARWADVVCAVDGDHGAFFINGRPAQRLELRYGRIPGDPGGVVTIGADPTSRAGALVSAYRGLLADLEAGDSIPGAASPQLIADPAPAPATRAGEIMTRGLEPGLYRMVVQGVDIFGRVGATRTSASLTLPDQSTPPRPGGARARFLPLLGTITSATPPSSGTSRWTIDVRLTRPTGALEASIAARLVRHDVELARVEPSEDGRQRIARAEMWEIAGATPTSDGVRLELVSPSLPRLRPEPGLRISIAHDLWLRTEWTWTGTQRLLAPRVTRFRLAERRGDTTARVWPTTWNALAEASVAGEDVIAVDEAAPPRACTEVTHAEWESLAERGIVSIPEPRDPSVARDPRRRQPRARIWKLVIPVTTRLSANPARLDPATLAPGDFVAGALVAYNAGVHTWQLLTVHWHEWSASTGWTIYFVENTRGRDEPETGAPALAQVRFYPGQRYRIDAMLSPPPTFAAGVATQPLEIAVAAIDTAGRESSVESPGDRRSTGAATAIAVDRMKPALPPRPEVAIGRADFHGSSLATVTWTAEAATSYHVYRATDNAVIARDVELRRTGQGIYADRAPAERVFDDEDFVAWLGARWPEWTSDWTTRLFGDKPARDSDTATRAAWDAATPVWDEWAARFYPSLAASSADPFDPGTLQGIAGRPGIEDAFVMVTRAPVTGGQHVDTVPGAVRNRYLYRLRSQSASLLQSTALGPVSAPIAPPQTRPPAAPEITGIEPGDRSATLSWSLVDDRSIDHYKLYRADTADALDDLRWFERDERGAVARVPEPRWLTERDDTSAFVRVGEIGVVVAVHASWDPRRTFNMMTSFDAAAGIVRLRRIATGSAVVVVVRESDGTERVVTRKLAAPPYTDTGLLGRHDYYYCVVAVDRAGNHSRPSGVKRVRTLEIEPPEVPPFTAERVAFDTDEHEVILRCPDAPRGLEVLVRRRSSGDRYARIVQDWRALASGHELRDRVGRTAGARYEVLVRTINHTMCAAPRVFTSTPSSVETP